MASALFKLSSDGGSSYLAAGTAMADANALAYVAAGSYSMKAALDSTSGVSAVAWSITTADDDHAASLPTVTTAVDKTCTFTVPKTGGAWILQCRVNGGVDAQGDADASLVKRLAIKVLTEGGYQVVAVGEVDEAGAYGWTKAHNDLARALDELGSGGAIVYQQGGVAGNGVYASWATAVAAAQDIAGAVTIYIDPSVDPPTIPAGTHDLDQRIRLVAFLSDTPGAPCALTIDSGAVFQDACYFENISFEGNLTTPLLTASSVALDVTFVRCKHVDAGNSDPFVTLPSGDNRFAFLGGSYFDLGFSGEAFAVLASGKNVDCVVEGFSFLNEFCFDGGAGTLDLSVDPGSVVEEQASFSGTLAHHDAAARIFRAQGVAGTVSLDSTTWTTVGTVRLDPSLLPDLSNGALAYALHADLEVIEASAGTVQAEVRLLDASLTSLGSVSSTLSGATTFPEHKSASLTAGGSNGQVKPTATTYLVQLRRSGGSSGDYAICHNACLEATWR